MLLLAVVTVSLGYSSLSEVPPAQDVVTLTDDNFDSLVLSGDPRHRQPWLVEFYTPWCPHCMTFANDFTVVGKRLKGTMNVGSVDVAANKALGRRFDVNSYPSFKMFGPDKTGPVQYQGARTVWAMVSKAQAVAAQWKAKDPMKEEKVQGWKQEYL